MAPILFRRSLAVLLCLSLSSVVKTSGQTPPPAGPSSVAEKLAARLISAGSEQERQAILAADKELISVELRKALISQGEVLRIKGNYPQAQATFELAQRVAEQIDDRVGVAEAGNALGTLRIFQSNFNEALELYQKSLTLCEALRDQDCTAGSLNGIGTVHRSKGNSDLAMEYFRKGLAVSEESGNKSKIALSLSNVGVAYQIKGNYTEALDYYQKSLDIAESIGDKARIASVKNWLGRTYTLRGELDLAIQYLRMSLALYEALGDKVGIANGFNNIGIASSMRGDYGSAMTGFQQGLATFEELGNKTFIVNGLGNIGIVHRRQGNLNLALEYQQRALALAQTLGSNAAVTSALNNIGLVYTDQGDYVRALESYRQGLKLQETSANKAEVANLLNNIAVVYRFQGSLDLAAENFGKALHLREELGDKWGAALALVGLARIYSAQGDHAKALEHAERAAALAREADMREVLWFALTEVGGAYRSLGQPARARQSFEESVLTIEALRAQVAGGGQDQQRFFEGKLSPYNQMVELLAEAGDAGGALAYAEQGKARVLLDVLRSGRVNVTKAMTAGEKEQERGLKAAFVSLNTQITGEQRRPQPDRARLAQLKAQLDRTRLDQDDFQSRLYAAHPDLRVKRGDAPPFSPGQAGELLTNSETALLEYVVTDKSTHLFVLTAGANTATPGRPQQPILKVYDLKIGRKELNNRVQTLRQRIANNDLGHAAPSAELYDVLVRPAEAQLRGKTRLVIVPDDVLWETPFQALRPTGGKYLIQTTAISYAPSLTVLRETIRSQRNPAAGVTLLAMGNPRIGAQTISRSKSVLMSGSLEPLPEAERMVKSLTRIYGPALSRVYVGAGASEDVLKTEAGKYRVLHLATHGVINDISPMYSHVVLSQGEGEREDGLLEAWEMMNLDLHADLVVLSACETARGRLGAGEGVIGMTWALFVAGVPTSVVSQWQVESVSTTELMIEFHRSLKGGAGKSEAMRRAALKLIADRRYEHPFYWAGFIVVGDGR